MTIDVNRATELEAGPTLFNFNCTILDVVEVKIGEGIDWTLSCNVEPT